MPLSMLSDVSVLVACKTEKVDSRVLELLCKNGTNFSPSDFSLRTAFAKCKNQNNDLLRFLKVTV